MKTLAGLNPLSTRRVGQDEYCVKVTTSILTLFDERVVLGGNDTNLTTLTSLSEGRVARTTYSSLSKKNWDGPRMELDQPLYQPMGF